VRHMRQAPSCHGIDDCGSAGRRMLTATRRAWTSYWTQRAARATAGILHRLDDRTLKDIGLDRSEIESVAYGGCQRRRPSLSERRICAS
jgi:uncharacterized protein YjiS (DUF1127 family)